MYSLIVIRTVKKLYFINVLNWCLKTPILYVCALQNPIIISTYPFLRSKIRCIRYPILWRIIPFVRSVVSEDPNIFNTLWRNFCRKCVGKTKRKKLCHPRYWYHRRYSHSNYFLPVLSIVLKSFSLIHYISRSFYRLKVCYIFLESVWQ